MRFVKLSLLFFMVLGLNISFAQAKKSAMSTKFKVPGGSKESLVFNENNYPYQAVGVKFGDPLALSYKFYPSKNFTFAADAGKVAGNLYNKYYRSAFQDYLPDTLSGESTLTYLSHKASKDWLIETKFLYQWDVERISKGLQLYAGVGWQWRSTNLTYDYLYQNGLESSHSGSFTEKRHTYGPVMVLGFEYSYFSLPISAFIEMELYTDLKVDPGYKRFQGGVGIRYVF